MFSMLSLYWIYSQHSFAFTPWLSFSPNCLLHFFVQKLFIFMSSHLSICAPNSLANWILFGKRFPTALSCSALRMFSSKSLRLSSFSGFHILITPGLILFFYVWMPTFHSTVCWRWCFSLVCRLGLGGYV